MEYPFLFVFWNEAEQKFIRNDKKFVTLFKEITAHAINEFNLAVRDDYIQYDLRRSCNLYLKLELGYSVEEAAAHLGHSVITNLMHYSLDENKIEIEKRRSENALKRATKANPELKDRYSLQFDKEVSNSSKPLSTGKPWKRVDITLDSEKYLIDDEAS